MLFLSDLVIKWRHKEAPAVFHFFCATRIHFEILNELVPIANLECQLHLIAN